METQVRKRSDNANQIVLYDWTNKMMKAGVDIACYTNVSGTSIPDYLWKLVSGNKPMEYQGNIGDKASIDLAELGAYMDIRPETIESPKYSVGIKHSRAIKSAICQTRCRFILDIIAKKYLWKKLISVSYQVVVRNWNVQQSTVSAHSHRQSKLQPQLRKYGITKRTSLVLGVV